MKKIIFITLILMIIIPSTVVFGANYNLNVEYDGKKIEMTSETPEMEWEINNLSKEQNAETSLIINSIGRKEVSVEFTAKLVDIDDIADILSIKVINTRSNETLYDGKYVDFQNISVKIPAKETNSIKIILSISEDVENSYNESFKMKFSFTAKGKKENTNINTMENSLDNVQENSQENIVEGSSNIAENVTDYEISTSIIKPIHKQSSYTIFVVFIIMIAVLIVLLTLFYKTNKVN